MRITPGWVAVGLGLTLGTLAAGACSKQRRDQRGGARDVGLAQPVVLDAAVVNFTASGWDGLPWSASPDDARTLLTARGLKFEEEEMRAYFANPQPGQPMHSNGLTLKFQLGQAQGQVNFESGQLLGVVLETASKLTEAEALAAQAALVRRWGAPALRNDYGGVPVLRWYSDTTMLESRVMTGVGDTTWRHLETWSPVGSDAGL
ncbi:MAG: hypothetical protein IT370_31810 [Deltaproteobacteria bacterium]|nr:hypothetical protein [Deltaproteobacteria bacterium]